MTSSAVTAALLVFGAGCVAGALNSVAGGGSFLSFPALLLTGLPPIVANATNNTAMWLGTLSSAGGYRSRLDGARGIVPALCVALAGSVIGAELLLHTPETTFGRMIPWLLLFATAVFAASGRLQRVPAGAGMTAERLSPPLLPALFAVSIYGGYFGAGIGILMLALFALSGWRDVHRMNAFKVVLAAAINGIAVIPFVLARRIAWEEALVLTAGAVLGGYVGARVALRLNPQAVRWTVVGVGAAMSAYFFIRPM